ncbi:hypothetical protein MUP37_00495 [Candidatus Bathyarchaeota archaeon]|nr:hypothetical protein [Candidatus Bathyarchaeota archaeon]
MKYIRRIPMANPENVPLEGYALLRSSTTTKSKAPPATEKKRVPKRLVCYGLDYTSNDCGKAR